MTPPDDGQPDMSGAPRAGFSAVTRTRFADHAFAVLFHKIVTGELAEGAALPSEHELSALFNISRPVVREALQRLRRENLIESRRGSGSFVRLRSQVTMSSDYVAEKRALLLQNLEFRMAIEPQAAAYAAERCTPAQLQVIEQAVEHFREVAIVEGSAGDHLDYGFHHAVAVACNNHRFVEAIETVEYDIDHGVNLVRYLVRFDHLERSRSVYEDHSRICAAIRDRDPDAARVFMRAHLENARRRMQQKQPLPAITAS
ncbi:MAG: FadR family transcriptional regulator [Rhodospirillales bacterium]|nr:FadR family transcriptional regulator [Rhodospirillales bacterium]MDE2199124.1 FadR family transcriptional regulator [Rhodospirillales bacterium]MDE2573773.1 FadR family transcriptional regulator [Rhodospirillales bacterium]